MRRLAALFILPVVLVLAACPPPEVSARNVIALAKGFNEDQQKQHHDECVADPTKTVCVAINKSIDSQNLAVAALKEYCADAAFVNSGGPCHPSKDAGPKLQLAISELTRNLADVKSLVGAPK